MTLPRMGSANMAFSRRACPAGTRRASPAAKGPIPLVAARRHDAIIKLWAFKPYPGPLPRECIMSHLTDWRRNLLSRLVAGLVFFATLFLVGGLMTGDLPAQQNKSKKGRVEEEVDDQKPKKNPPVKEEMEKGSKQKRK